MYDPWQGPETLNSPPGRFSVQQRCLLAQKSKPKSKPRLTGTEWQVSFYSVRSVDLETENRTWERAGIPTSNSSVWNTRPQTWLSHWKHCLIYQGPKSLLCSPNVLKDKTTRHHHGGSRQDGHKCWEEHSGPHSLVSQFTLRTAHRRELTNHYICIRSNGAQTCRRWPVLPISVFIP